MIESALRMFVDVYAGEFTELKYTSDSSSNEIIPTSFLATPRTRIILKEEYSRDLRIVNYV